MLKRQIRASLKWFAAALVVSGTVWCQRGQSNFVAGRFPAVQAQQSTYSVEEYNQYQEAAAQKDAQQQIALLDAFVAKYPNSALMSWVFNLYYPAYARLKNYPKAFEYADKLVALGAPLGSDSRLEALYTRCQYFESVFDAGAPDAREQLAKNRDDALEALGLFAQLRKPSNSTDSDAQFAEKKKTAAATLHDVVGVADLKLQDFGAAEDALKSAVSEDPADGTADYYLGIVYLKKTPPQYLDAFWLIARAVPTRPDAEARIRKYLRGLIMAYQHSGCESLADNEVSEIMRAAAKSADRPADFTIPSEVSQEQQCAAQAPVEAVAPIASEDAPQSDGSHRGLVPENALELQAPVQNKGRYYALVIGINDYLFAPKLKTAVKDAEDVASVLREQYGFETKLLPNATREQIIHALSEYRRRLGENASLLIYYAGHGVYDKDADKTYWLPADGGLQDTSNWIIADEITTDIRVIPARHILVISDSCYSGGITRSVEMAFTPQEQGRYLGKMIAGRSRTLMSSGGLEPVSDEGGAGHSVFASALLRGLTAEEDTTFSAESLFEEFIRVSVAGRSEQTPQYNVIRNSGHDAGDFVFIRSK